MATPSQLVENHYTITLGGVALMSADGHDFFPPGEELSISHSQAVDTPDCAGRPDGAIYGRGNLRWEVSFTRIRSFHDYSYPVADEDLSDDPIATPVQHAQLWLIHHMTALKNVSTALDLGFRAWPTAVCEPSGTTDSGFAIVEYRIQMSGDAA